MSKLKIAPAFLLALEYERRGSMKMHIRRPRGYFALFCLCGGTHEVLAVDGTALGALGMWWLPLVAELVVKPSIAEERYWNRAVCKNRGTESCTRIKSWVIAI